MQAASCRPCAVPECGQGGAPGRKVCGRTYPVREICHRIHDSKKLGLFRKIVVRNIRPVEGSNVPRGWNGAKSKDLGSLPLAGRAGLWAGEEVLGSVLGGGVLVDSVGAQFLDNRERQVEVSGKSLAGAPVLEAATEHADGVDSFNPSWEVFVEPFGETVSFLSEEGLSSLEVVLGVSDGWDAFGHDLLLAVEERFEGLDDGSHHRLAI
jgi:hypothetical protein